MYCKYHATHHNRFTTLFPGPPRWAGAKRELLDFVVQGKINRGRHRDYPAGRHSIRTNQCPPPTSPFFTGRMPFLSPNQQCESTEGKIAVSKLDEVPSFIRGACMCACVQCDVVVAGVWWWNAARQLQRPSHGVRRSRFKSRHLRLQLASRRLPDVVCQRRYVVLTEPAMVRFRREALPSRICLLCFDTVACAGSL